MIINIRGTSGSGKSTIVRKLMKKYNAVSIVGKDKKIEGYEMLTPFGNLFIVGKYETPCGGCDAITSQDEVCNRVKKYARKGHVIFEGVIVSTCYKRYKELLTKSKHPYAFIFLSTKLVHCIKGIENRRKARGDTRPVNPSNTESKYRTVLRDIERAKEDNLNYIVTSRNKAVEEIERCLKESC